MRRKCGSIIVKSLIINYFFHTVSVDLVRVVRTIVNNCCNKDSMPTVVIVPQSLRDESTLDCCHYASVL